MMTRKEMITKCVEEQIERGIIKPEDKEFQVKMRKRMSYSSCLSWYESVFSK